MKILLYIMNWYPFEGACTHIFANVITHLRKQGHEVTILTSMPYYIKGRYENWPSFRFRLFSTETWNGIKVKRVAVLSPKFMKKIPLLLRIINFLAFICNSLLVGIFMKRPDVIMTVSHPPLAIGTNAFLISRLQRCPYVYCLEDIYPDILVDLNMLKEGPVLKLLKKIELFVYTRAKKVCVLSEWMKKNLLAKKVDPEKVEIIAHFADIDDNPPNRNNRLSKELGLDSSFVVLLPGSITYRCGLDTVFETMKLLRDKPEILFVYIERGPLKEDFRQKIEKERLPNTKFVPFQSSENFPYLMASADACLVSLEECFAAYSVPSKVYKILAAARPVIAITNETSEVANIVKKAACGVTVPCGNPSAAADAISNLAANREKTAGLGKNGYDFAKTYFNKTQRCSEYENLLQDIVKK